MKTRTVSAGRSRLAFWFFLLSLLLVVRGTAFAAIDKTLYGEALASGWQNWSWAAVDTASTANAHTGTVSIAVTPTAWSALYLRSADAPLDTTGYLSFTFWVHGGVTGGQTIQVVAVVNDMPQPGVRVASPTAGSWQKVTVPLSALGADARTDVNGFWVQEGAGIDEPTFYVDDVVLESGVPPTPRIVDSTDPAGPADRYPTFYVDKLLKYFARGGETVVQAQSDYRGLGVYAVKDKDHRLNILVINKHPSAALNASISIPALEKGERVKLFSYGIPEDDAAHIGTGSADVQQSSLTLEGTTLTFSPGPYSASVIQLSKRERPRHDKSDDCWGDDDPD